MTDDEKERYRARFFAARSPKELLELAHEMARDHPKDPYAMSLAEMVANAIAAEWPQGLENL
jgi:hypothetical protein